MMKNSTFFVYILVTGICLIPMQSAGIERPLIPQAKDEQHLRMKDAYFTFYKKTDEFLKARAASQPHQAKQALNEGKEALKSIQTIQPNNVKIKAFMADSGPIQQNTQTAKIAVNDVYFGKYPQDFPEVFSYFLNKLQKEDPESKNNALIFLQHAKTLTTESNNKVILNHAMQVINDPKSDDQQIRNLIQQATSIFQPKTEHFVENETQQLEMPEEISTIDNAAAEDDKSETLVKLAAIETIVQHNATKETQINLQANLTISPEQPHISS